MLTESEFKLKHLLTKKEISAFRGEIPMNQSLFNKIVDKMMGCNMGEHTFDEFIIRHQEFLPEYNQQIEYDRFIGEDPEWDLLQEKWEIYQEKYGIDPYLEP
jgi:hypothetical protein